MSTNDGSSRHDPPACPYCGRSVHWIPNRWFGRGCFQCEDCGDFPDFRGAGAPPSPDGNVAGGVAPPAMSKRDDRPRVLLVDDSTEHRDLYAMMLEDFARVVTASRGEDALAMAGAAPPDAIILDVMMPGLDGWRVCERLRANPITAHIPIVLLTSLDTGDMPARARRAGANAVLTKPCPVERLVLTLNASMHPDAGRR